MTHDKSMPINFDIFDQPVSESSIEITPDRKKRGTGDTLELLSPDERVMFRVSNVDS
jgi:hypothetical protein